MEKFQSLTLLVLQLQGLGGGAGTSISNLRYIGLASESNIIFELAVRLNWDKSLESLKLVTFLAM